MSYIKRLDRAFVNAPILPIGVSTKYVFLSDCHRGIGNNNDNFLKNKNTYLAALQYYYQYGFTYIEVGDGDELWENRCLDEIIDIHGDVFALLADFHRLGRLYMLYGNHDMAKKHCLQCFQPLFPDFKLYEGIIFRVANPLSISHNANLPDILVTHGHQASFLNSTLWKLARFLVRYLWSPLEYFALKDPTSAAKNNTLRNKTEHRLTEYASKNNSLLLAGHTHKPTLSSHMSPYMNCGSCVHPRGITCIELCGTHINLVRWYPSTTKSGHLRNLYGKCPPEYPVYIKREVLETQRL